MRLVLNNKRSCFKVYRYPNLVLLVAVHLLACMFAFITFKCHLCNYVNIISIRFIMFVKVLRLMYKLLSTECNIFIQKKKKNWNCYECYNHIMTISIIVSIYKFVLWIIFFFKCIKKKSFAFLEVIRLVLEQ